MKRWSIIRCRMSTLPLPSIYNGQQNIYKKYSSIWYLYTKAEILIDWLRRRVVQFKIVMSASYDTQTEKIKSFWHKKFELLEELKFYPEKWVTGEYLSQIDSAFRVKLTQHWEFNWLNIESQIGSTLRVKLNQHWESNWINFESSIDSNILQLFTLPGRIIIPPVTQLLMSKWLNSQKIESFWPKRLGQILVLPVTTF